MTLSRTSSKEALEKWMSCPEIFCEFPGLAYLDDLTQLVIAQKQDKLHDLIEKHDISYTIYNNLGEKLFIGVQKNQATQFTAQLYNIYGNEVIQVKKTCKYFVSKLLIWAPPGYFVGSVEKSVFQNKFEVKNGDGTVVIFIKKLDPRDLVYSVLVGGKAVGTVMRDWGKNPYENYMVSFPKNLELSLKAVMLGACLLIM